MLAIAGIQAAGQLLSAYKGTRDAASQNSQTKKLIQRNLNRAEAERKAKGNNYLDTTEGKALVTQAAKSLREATLGVNDNAVKGSQTTAQRLAQQGAAQRQYGNIIQNLAARSNAYRQQADNILQNARNQYTQGMTSVNTMAAQSDVNSGLGVAQALGNTGLAAMLMLKGYTPTKSTTGTPATTTQPQAQPSTIIPQQLGSGDFLTPQYWEKISKRA